MVLALRIKSVDDFLSGGFMEGSDDDLEEGEEGVSNPLFQVFSGILTACSFLRRTRCQKMKISTTMLPSRPLTI